MTQRSPSAGRIPSLPSTGAIAVAACVLMGALSASAAAPMSPPEIQQGLREFRETGSVLYVAAHPDDENTQLIAYLARGRNYRTAYLSLTRGDGGQNVLGPEFGDLLGVIRTQELLAARRVDGGRQFFSRARDFGYSKDYKATLTKWDREQVLSDIVRVIRTFRPDVVVTRFSPEPGGTHGHHTASAALAIEAFKMAGDPNAFPEQLATLAPWQPTRIVWNSFGGYRPGPDTDAGSIHIGIDGTDPVTGATFAVLAAKSRSMHQTQGFANFSVAAGGSGPHEEAFIVLAGEPMKKDIMDGVDTTWARIGGPEAGAVAGDILDHFNPANPSASVPALLQLRATVERLGDDPLVAEKRELLDRILQSCLGLSVETTVASVEVVPGETLGMAHTASILSSIPVRWVGVRYPGNGLDAVVSADLVPGQPAKIGEDRILSPKTPLNQPYWLRQDGTPGMFQVDDPELIGLPENPAAVPVEDVFQVGGQTLVVRDEAVCLVDDPKLGRVRRRLEVIPPVSLAFSAAVDLFAPGSSHDVSVEVTSARADVAGVVRLQVPDGWGASPASRDFRLAKPGDHATVTFSVTAPPTTSSRSLAAWADVDGASYGNGRHLISYGHIPPQLLLPSARLRTVSLDLAIHGHRVGYLPGAGDSVAGSLSQMGFEVTQLEAADLTAATLATFDAVVIGVRAFDTRPELATLNQALFDYVAGGGTVVEQYNTPGTLKTKQIAPYALEISRDLPRYRVTNEAAPMTFLDPAHPALTGPNRIGPADFDGWVQERGLDFGSSWDTEHFTALLACSDVGEAPLKGGLLVARFGKGYFVYTGLSFFRQLPAGVPGAYRLLANLVSLGR